METTGVRKARIPHGVADLFYEEAAAITSLERILHDLFLGWGYNRIIPPTFEYYDTLVTQASPQLQEEMFRFFDREGQLLALRPDMTVPTARIVGGKLYDQPMPLRFYYIGHVFRYEEPQAGKQREFTQAGIELIGADTAAADAEVLALTIDTLHKMGLSEFQINLGQIGFLAAILSEGKLANGELRRLEQAIDRRNDRELQRVLVEYGVPDATARILRAIPRLCGDRQILAEARSFAINDGAKAALERLDEVYAILERNRVAQHVILDLGEIRNMAYYTGIVYRGYLSGLGFPVCGGGRYDGLLAHFGDNLPAVGFAISLERAMSVTKLQVSIAPDLLLQSCRHTECASLVAKARELGLYVEVDVLNRPVLGLMEYGRQRKAGHILVCTQAPEYRLVEGVQERRMTLEQLAEEMTSWKR
ncbi:MAG: ATP phosphoribosyltransferase regulatory subunit [Anaerolineae bacterium]